MNDLQRQINELRDEINKLKSASSIPFDVEQAIRERLNISSFSSLSTSTKSASSENQAVNEGGSGNYSVLGPPDGFEERVVNGVTHYYAYWL